MFPTFVFASLDGDSDRFCKFNVTVYCKRENLEIAKINAAEAAANADGAIMAQASDRIMLVNCSERDELEEIIEP